MSAAAEHALTARPPSAREAVYANHNRNLAIAFAPPKIADAGYIAWHLDENRWSPGIVMRKGSLDTSRVGYLHHLPADSFKPVDEWQWVSFVAVKPVRIQVIRPEEYAPWVRYEQA